MHFLMLFLAVFMYFYHVFEAAFLLVFYESKIASSDLAGKHGFLAFCIIRNNLSLSGLHNLVSTLPGLSSRGTRLKKDAEELRVANDQAAQEIARLQKSVSELEDALADMKRVKNRDC